MPQQQQRWHSHPWLLGDAFTIVVVVSVIIIRKQRQTQQREGQRGIVFVFVPRRWSCMYE
jgi:hypothetical protein